MLLTASGFRNGCCQDRAELLLQQLAHQQVQVDEFTVEMAKNPTEDQKLKCKSHSSQEFLSFLETLLADSLAGVHIGLVTTAPDTWETETLAIRFGAGLLSGRPKAGGCSWRQ